MKPQTPAFFLLLIASLFFFAPDCSADSIFRQDLPSPYSTQKIYKVGDVITILILETTSAVQKAGTDTQNQDNLSASFSHTIERITGTIAPNNSASAAWGNKYKGAGATTRSSNVIAAVSAQVSDIEPGGNLRIMGHHKVSVNEEKQDIVVKGVIRTKDITSWNTIYSYQVADADISVKGVGTVGTASSPGVITRILDMIF